MVSLVLGYIFPLLWPGASFVSWGTQPICVILDTKVNKGCTVTTQAWHQVKASCQLPARVQSRLMGSKKAVRKRGNFRNSKTTNSLSHMEGCLVLCRTALDSLQMASQGCLHWGTGNLLGVMRAMDWPMGMGNESTLSNQAWSGQRGRVWVKECFSDFLS